MLNSSELMLSIWYGLTWAFGFSSNYKQVFIQNSTGSWTGFASGYNQVEVISNLFFITYKCVFSVRFLVLPCLKLSFHFQLINVVGISLAPKSQMRGSCSFFYERLAEFLRGTTEIAGIQDQFWQGFAKLIHEKTGYPEKVHLNRLHILHRTINLSNTNFTIPCTLTKNLHIYHTHLSYVYVLITQFIL